MDELFLKRVSLIVFLIGFISLLVLFYVEKPFFVSKMDYLDSNKRFRLNATIIDVYESKEGSLLIFDYQKRQNGFFKGNTSYLKLNETVQIKGIKNDDFISIEEIILI